MHDKTFFYVNYEGLRQRLDGTQIGLVPSPAFAAQAALTSPALTPDPARLIQRARRRLPIPVSGSTTPRADRSTTKIRGWSAWIIISPIARRHFVRFNADEAVEAIPTGQLNATTRYDTKFNNGVAALSHVFTPSLINETKFGLNQTIYHTANLSPVPFGVARLRLQFPDRIFHHRLSFEDLRSYRRCFLGEGQTRPQVRDSRHAGFCSIRAHRRAEL